MSISDFQSIVLYDSVIRINKDMDHYKHVLKRNLKPFSYLYIIDCLNMCARYECVGVLSLKAAINDGCYIPTRKDNIYIPDIHNMAHRHNDNIIFKRASVCFFGWHWWTVSLLNSIIINIKCIQNPEAVHCSFIV